VSHFFVGVLVPKDTRDIEAKVNELLAPYDENISVEPYDEKCFCVNRLAKKAGHAAAEAFKPLDDLRKEFHATYHPDNDEAWREFIKEYEKIDADATKAHPLFEKPDPACDECNGTGVVTSTSNPKSQWDWFVIGGRWDGTIQRAPRDDGKGGFNFGEEHHLVKNNYILVKDVLDETKAVTAALTHPGETYSWMPYALVTPDGKWHEKGVMGWFGMARNEAKQEDWEKEVMRLLNENLECKLVGVDCHV
jgi:hypothetical protein